VDPLGDNMPDSRAVDHCTVRLYLVVSCVHEWVKRLQIMCSLTCCAL